MRERAPGVLGGWRPLCAICALIGIRVEADTLLSHPVCMDHAVLLAREGLLRAADIAARDIEQDSPALALQSARPARNVEV